MSRLAAHSCQLHTDSSAFGQWKGQGPVKTESRVRPFLLPEGTDKQLVPFRAARAFWQKTSSFFFFCVIDTEAFILDIPV